MKIVDRVARQLGVAGIGLVDEPLPRPEMVQPVYGEQATRDLYTDDLIFAYRYHAWVFAGVRAIAMSVGNVPMIVVEYQQSPRMTARDFAMRWRAKNPNHLVTDWPALYDSYLKAEGAKIVREHEVIELIENPYPDADRSRPELMHAIVTNLELDGSAYAEKIWNGGSRKRKLPSGLWAEVDPRKVRVIPGKKTLIDGYLFWDGTKRVVLGRNDMLAFRYFNPLNPYYGQSPTRTLRTALIADVKAVDWNRLFFDKDATPSGLLSTDQSLTPADIDFIRSSWNDRYRGQPHEIGVVGHGAKFQTISPTHKDMGFKDLRELTRKEIQAAYGVPAIVLGDYEDANRASAMTMARLYTLNTVLPRLSKIESVLSHGLLGTKSRLRLIFDLSTIESLQEDILIRARAGNYMRQQYLTPNEIRAMHNLQPGDGPLMNSVFVDSKLTVAGVVGGGTIPEMEPRQDQEDEREEAPMEVED